MVGPLADSAGPRDRVTAADQAWDAVLAFVTEAPEGTRLPAERALAERLGVSRSTLRSALSRLELLGHVEVRHGSGVVVRRPKFDAMVSRLFAGVRPEPSNALALRKLLEPGLAGLAARRGNVAEMEGADEEAAFHTALAAASGNELAAQFVGALVSLSGPSRLRPELHAAQHAAITAAVAARDARSAAGATRVHLDALERS